MAHTYMGSGMVVAAVGDSVTTSGSSAAAAIPNDSSGRKPNYIRVSATKAAHIKLGADSLVAATGDDLLVQPGDAAILAVPKGYTHFAFLQTAEAGVVNVVPLENS